MNEEASDAVRADTALPVRPGRGHDAAGVRAALRDLPAPTPRLFLLVLVLMLPLGLGTVAPFFLGIAAAGAMALIGAMLADYATAVPGKQLAVERRHEPRLYLGVDNPIDLRVANGARRAIAVRLRDTPPPRFQSSRLFSGGEVAAATEGGFPYSTRPHARGVYHFGETVLRWKTPLGLLWRQRTFPLDEEVAVYPNLLEIEKYDLLVRRGRLREMGLRSVRHLGRGTEFESLRDYQPDDDFRRINWKATARRQRPITTLHETERSQRLILLLDVGRMMLTRVGELTRLDYAVNAAVLLAYVALERGDRVGLVSFGGHVTSYVRPGRGRRHFYQILEQLYAVRAQPLASDYAGAFARLRSDLHGRSLVALFTDIGDPSSAQIIARHLTALARHHLPVCIALADPALADRARLLPQSGRDVYAKVVAGQLIDERATILDQLRRHGVLTVDVPADRLTMATINRYLELKEHSLL